MQNDVSRLLGIEGMAVTGVNDHGWWLELGVEPDPFRDWICGQLSVDPRLQSQRLRELATELGYDGGKSIFNDLSARSVRGLCGPERFSERSIGRGSVVQCNLWEPAERVPVGHGQRRRGWVVTCDVKPIASRTSGCRRREDSAAGPSKCGPPRTT